MTEATQHDVTESVPGLDRFSAPHDWAAIDEAVTSAGGAVVKGLLGARMLDALNDEIDAYLTDHVGAGNSATGSDGYDLFLGRRTTRLHRVAVATEQKRRSGVAEWPELADFRGFDAVEIVAAVHVQVGSDGR